MVRIYDVEDGNTFVAVNPEKRIPIRISGEGAPVFRNAIESGSLGTVDAKAQDILKEYLFGKSPVKIAPWSREARFPVEEISLYLLLTNSCGNRCLYCFEDNPCINTSSGSLSIEHALKAIELALNAADSVKIVFFGGEPLMCAERLVEIAKKAPESEKLFLSVTSNLVNLPEEVLEIAKKKNIGFLTCLDGPPDVHERLRPSVMGYPTFKRITENIRKLRDAGVICDIRTTVTSINLPYLRDFVEFLESEFGMERFNFPPLSIFRSDGSLVDVSILPDPEEYLRFLRYMIVEKGVLPTKIHPIDSHAKTYLSGNHVRTPCGMARGHVIEIDPEGYVWPCSYLMGDRKYCMGHIDDENVLSMTWFRELNERLYPFACTESFDICRECDLKSMCGGGCAIPWMRVRTLNGREKELAERYSRGIYCGVAELAFEIMSVHFTEEVYRGRIGLIGA